jgi:4-amino-4-deoxy-L-arabinose transferase
MSLRRVLGLFFVYLAIFILPLGARPVAITDEARYAEIPREMIASADWVVPHLDGLRYFEKPVMGYWLTALSMIAFGENPFGVRFSSAAAVGVTAFLLYWLVRRETEDVAAAVCSCLAYLTSLLVVVVGTSNLLDTMFTAFVTASMVSFLAAYRAAPGARRTIFLTLLGLSCAMGFLTKGFLAFALPVIVVVPFLLWMGDARKLPRLAAWPIVVAAVAILPWAIAIQRREGDFWRYFFWVEHIHRFLSEHAQHAQPAWYFVPILLLGALPWTPVLPAALLGSRHEVRERSVVPFLACWFVFPFVFFSASRGKLGTYVLPCFPALAGLVGTGLLSCLRGSRRRPFDVGAGLLAALAAGAGVTLALSQLVPRIPMRLYAPEEGSIWIVPVAGLIACSALAAAAIRTRTPGRALATFALAPVLLCASIPFVMPQVVVSARSADSFLREHRSVVPPGSLLVADVDRVAPTCWFFRRSDVSVLERRGELDYGLDYDDAASRYLRVPDLRRLIDENRGQRPITVVTTKEHYDEYRRGLPDPEVVEIDPRLKDGRALVIARYQ